MILLLEKERKEGFTNAVIDEWFSMYDASCPEGRFNETVVAICWRTAQFFLFNFTHRPPNIFSSTAELERFEKLRFNTAQEIITKLATQTQHMPSILIRFFYGWFHKIYLAVETPEQRRDRMQQAADMMREINTKGRGDVAVLVNGTGGVVENRLVDGMDVTMWALYMNCESGIERLERSCEQEADGVLRSLASRGYVAANYYRPPLSIYRHHTAQPQLPAKKPLAPSKQSTPTNQPPAKQNASVKQQAPANQHASKLKPSKPG